MKMNSVLKMYEKMTQKGRGEVKNLYAQNFEPLCEQLAKLHAKNVQSIEISFQPLNVLDGLYLYKLFQAEREKKKAIPVRFKKIKIIKIVRIRMLCRTCHAPCPQYFKYKLTCFRVIGDI